MAPGEGKDWFVGGFQSLTGNLTSSHLLRCTFTRIKNRYIAVVVGDIGLRIVWSFICSQQALSPD